MSSFCHFRKRCKKMESKVGWFRPYYSIRFKSNYSSRKIIIVAKNFKFYKLKRDGMVPLMIKVWCIHKYIFRMRTTPFHKSFIKTSPNLEVTLEFEAFRSNCPLLIPHEETFYHEAYSLSGREKWRMAAKWRLNVDITWCDSYSLGCLITDCSGSHAWNEIWGECFYRKGNEFESWVFSSNYETTLKEKIR